MNGSMNGPMNGPMNGLRAARLIFAFVSVVFLLPSLSTAGGPENIVLVVNSDSRSSKMIANYYIDGRKIPTRNVIYLSGIPAKETTNAKTFREKILVPVLDEIEKRGLFKSVDYIVYSSDFPTMITIKDDLEKLTQAVKESTGKELQRRVFNPSASITSMTFYAAAIKNGDPGYMMLDSNAYYRQPASVLLRRPFVGERQKEFETATGRLKSGDPSDLAASIKTLESMAQKNPEQLAVVYWLARFYAQSGDAGNATKWLTRAIQLGWCYRKQTLSDLVFDNVKDNVVFKEIVQRIPDQPFDFVPTYGFRSSSIWGPNGMRNREANQGNRHFLSTVLAVTRNHGNTEKQALKQLKRTMRADESRPQGTFYFTQTSNVRTTTRKANVAKAIDALQAMGFKTKIVKSVMPKNCRDIIGLTCGTAKFDWASTNSRIMPGAFCDNLTSYGGALHRSGQTKISEFIAAGAAGASGTVVEPLAIQAKFPHPMVHVHYARGCTLAEAYYQSVHGPFQLLIVGDALCQPWAVKPVLVVSGVEPGDTIKGKNSWQLDASQSKVRIARIELYVDGALVHQSPLRDSITFDTSGMTDGYHEIRIVPVANNLLETRGHVILPIQIDNKGISTQLTCERNKYSEKDEIVFLAQSNYGDSISLMHNGRLLGKKEGRKVEFRIPAAELGRGPVSVVAIAVSKLGNRVASMPVKIRIDGKISDVKVNTQAKPKPKPKK